MLPTRKECLICLFMALCMFWGLLNCGDAKAEPGDTELGWMSVPNATCYRVHWGTEIDNLFMSINVELNTKAIIPDLACNTKYFAIVRAYNGDKPSPPTQTIEFTSALCPPELVIPGDWDVKGIWIEPKQE